ncbi:hypothetical protein LJC38_03745 [Parabacteroides sp. OttesenSCG-928-K15]|nr:hypothetical protein [Parabacteroides sp. OttesenSCG-928-K15]
MPNPLIDLSLMRRLASHFVWYRNVHHLSFIEIDDKGCFAGVFPLQEEIAGTAFFDGVLLPVPADCEEDVSWENWKEVTAGVEAGSPVRIIHIAGLDTAAAKLGTYDSSCRCHIQRL